MNFFNRQKARTPADTVKSLRENIQRLDQSESGESKRRVSLIFSSKDIAPPARGLKEIGLIGLASFVETWSSTEPLTSHGAYFTTCVSADGHVARQMRRFLA